MLACWHSSWRRGLDDDFRRAPRDPELPKHVYKRGKKLMVVFPGEKKRRTADDVSAAQMMLDHGPFIDVDASEDEDDQGASVRIDHEQLVGEAPGDAEQGVISDANNDAVNT